MATFANSAPISMKDGIAYAIGAILPPLEIDIGNQPGPNQGNAVPVLWGEAVLAIVQFVATGTVPANSYVVLQCDLGDGVWIDIAGVIWSGTSGTATFVISAGVAGNNAFQASRAANSAPAANFSNAMTLGGRLRFVAKSGQSASSSSSSSSSGTPANVAVTIRFKLLGLR
jgi:hypothetical protein